MGQRTPSGQRQVSEILRLGRRVENGIIESSNVFTRQLGDLVLAPAADLSHDKLTRAGIDIAPLMAGTR